MITLRPWLRLYRTADGAFLEAVLAERALPVDDALLAVVRALAAGPAETGSDIAARAGLDKGAVHGALARLSGLGLIDVGGARLDTAGLWAELGRGMSELPVVDNVELTNICPMSCVMCPTGTGRMTRPKGHMDPALFARLVDEIAPHKNHGKPLALHNLGESLLHPQLVALVATAARAGLVTELSANPGHLPLELFCALEDAGLSRLVLSLDGVEPATLTAIRGKGARADRAFAHLEAILERRRASSTRHTRVLVQMIRQRENEGEVEAFLARYGGLADIGIDAYAKELDANTDGAGDLVQIGRPPRPYLCRAPWRSVVVLWNGDVVPCCHDANGAVVYGSLVSGTLRAAWASAQADALRARLSTGGVAPGEPCHGCAHRADRYAVPPLDEIPVEPLHW